MLFADLLFMYAFLPLCFLFYFTFKSIKVKNAVLIAFNFLRLRRTREDIFICCKCADKLSSCTLDGQSSRQRQMQACFNSFADL